MGTNMMERDPDCTCGWSPVQGRIWCEHCRTVGPKPGSLADPAVHEDPHGIPEPDPGT